MKLLKGTYTNFGSYRELEFDYGDLGLALVSGPTGAGKSTVMDAAAWCLYGITSKEGSVDEVRSWGSEENTTGVQGVYTLAGQLTVFRTRGTPSKNDLYWVEAASPDKQNRGKDINETQKLLEKRLGVSAELYFTSSYFHQFSRADSFFIAKAKERREILERISDLSLPIRIADTVSEARKSTKRDLELVSEEFARLDGKLQQLKVSFDRTLQAEADWNDNQSKCIEQLKAKEKSFEQEKKDSQIKAQRQVDQFELERDTKIDAWTEELAALDKKILAKETFDSSISDLKALIDKAKKQKCPTCGGPKKADDLDRLRTDLGQAETDRRANEQTIRDFDALADKIEALQKQINPYEASLAQATGAVNHYAEQIVTKSAEKNPHSRIREATKADIEAGKVKYEALSEQIKGLETRVAALTQLYDLSFELRGKLLENAVRDIECATNAKLEKYFDGEIRVKFELASDKLDVEIQKNGYVCSFRQLSGGQRCLLKLCFSVSLMAAAANKAGVHFDNLFLDEALNGLDDALKVKAFGLLQELESNHESVLVIDHCEEFKSLFANRFQVNIEEDASRIVRLGEE